MLEREYLCILHSYTSRSFLRFGRRWAKKPTWLLRGDRKKRYQPCIGIIRCVLWI